MMTDLPSTLPLTRRVAITLATLWFGFLLLQLCGGITRYALLGVGAFTLLVLAALKWGGGKRELARITGAQLLTGINHAIPAWVIWFYAALFSSALSLANWLGFEVMDGTLWDLTTYTQPTYTQAKLGNAYMTFAGEVASIYSFHITPVPPILGWFYNVFDSLAPVFIWQSFFLTAPAWVFALYWQGTTRAIAPAAYGFVGSILSFWIYTHAPTFSGQSGWPYVFFVGGLVFYALAFYSWSRRQWGLMALWLMLFTLQKTEFWIYACVFAAIVALDLLKLGRSYVSRARAWAWLGVAVGFAFAVHLYWSRHGGSSAISFAARFGNLGNTPFEALINLFTDPARYWNAWARPLAVKYWGCFVAASLIWLRIPRWESHKYFLAVAPFVLLNVSSEYLGMILLRDHYGLPLLVGAGASAILGISGSYLRERRTLMAHLALLISVLAGAAYGSGDVFKLVGTTYRTYIERTESRVALKPLREDRDVVVCCEDRMCSIVSDRPVLLNWEICRDGGALLTEHVGKRVVYLTYSKTEYPAPKRGKPGHVQVPWPPSSWAVNAPHFKQSAEMRVPPPLSD